jgi:ribosomal protein RSM22 (predicted rRNA methylase)
LTASSIHCGEAARSRKPRASNESSIARPLPHRSPERSTTAPHAAPCPIVAPDWCHFSRRVARSRLHRLAKDGDVPWEDEKFIYLAASRTGDPHPMARVLARPRVASGAIRLKLCNPTGQLEEWLVTKRQGDAFKVARRIDWGDRL